MTTMTERAITCPDWCIDHYDANIPGGRNADLSKYDEVTQGHFAHRSADETVGEVEVSVAVCMDWDGRELEPPAVFVDGTELTPSQALRLATVLLEASARVRSTTEQAR